MVLRKNFLLPAVNKIMRIWLNKSFTAGIPQSLTDQGDAFQWSKSFLYAHLIVFKYLAKACARLWTPLKGLWVVVDNLPILPKWAVVTVWNLSQSSRCLLQSLPIPPLKPVLHASRLVHPASTDMSTTITQVFLSPGAPPQTALKPMCLSCGLSNSHQKATRENGYIGQTVADWPNLVSSATPGARPPRLLSSICNL